MKITRSWLLRYGVAVLFSGLALILTLLLRTFITPAVFPLFYAAVMISAWYGGLGPGLLSTILAALFGHFFIIPFYSSDIGLENTARLAVFVMVALLISSLNASRKRAEEALRKAHEELEMRVEERTAELARTNEELRTEISERKRVEQEREQLIEQLELARERLETVLRQMPAGVIIAEAPSGKLIMANEQFEYIWRHPFLPLENIEQYYQYKGFHPDGQPYKPEEWPLARSIRTGESVTDEEIAFLRGDGTRGTMRVSSAPIRDREGKIVAGVVSLYDITERKQAEEQIKNSREQLRALSAHLQLVREEERARIAREIHDELGQALTGLKIDLSWLDGKLSEARNAAPRRLLLEKIKSMIKLIDTTIHTVRRIVTELRPGVLDDLGLMAAIEWQAQDFQNRTGVKCDLASSLEDIDLDQDRSTAVFRIFQETLTNVARHSGATKVDIILEERDGSLILEVKDNGRGITENGLSSSKSLGILGMRERALLLGGEIDILGAQGKGTTVTLRVPLPDHSQEQMPEQKIGGTQ